ncbi:hypothetical protein HYU89_02025 [Candidatus Collierbacteria bacterium]|nr:hypothetical protein [Candidatus Collierbacteria bacterium]
MEGEKDLPSVNTGGNRVSKEEEEFLAKLFSAKNRGSKDLNPDERQTISEVNKKFKPVGRSVSGPISPN